MTNRNVVKGVTDADRLNILQKQVEDYCAAEDRLNRVRPVVRSMGEQLQAFSLHPISNLPSPVPGRPRHD